MTLLMLCTRIYQGKQQAAESVEKVDYLTKVKVFTDEEKAVLFGKTFKTQYDEKVDNFDMVKELELTDEQKEVLQKLTVSFFIC